MAVSQVDLANDALGLLMRDSIRDLDGSTPAAVQTGRFMPRAIDEVIGEYDWPECRVVKALTAVSDVNTRGWSFAYAIPSDAVVLWGVGELKNDKVKMFELGMSDDITKDTTYVFTDEAAPAVRYGSRRANLSRFPPDVFGLMAIRLAMKCCMPLVKDPKLFKFLEDRYKSEASKAKTRVANLEPEIQDTDFIPELISVRSA